DAVTQGPLQWELVTGAQGSLVISTLVSTNIAGLAYTSYYLDDATPSDTQCTGDAFAYGSSGVRISQSIPCTDPALDCTNVLQRAHTLYYDGPGLTVSDAQDLDAKAQAPLTVSAVPHKQPDGDTDGDTIPNSSDPDDDNDGCTDDRENGADPAQGGLRNPHHFWDFFDVWTQLAGNPPTWQRNKVVDLFGDIFGVAMRFGASGNPSGDPLVAPTSSTGYHTAFDRAAAPGGSALNLQAADGTIDLFTDIFGVAFQFGHDCS
ncbi:MAG: flexitail domain-containing putative surface protein, partial [Dehalococcoidia bacterium]|nr:flexitail domain-containing putative surface protein [Dehalococcoidia bacterium]